MTGYFRVTTIAVLDAETGGTFSTRCTMSLRKAMIIYLLPATAILRYLQK